MALCISYESQDSWNPLLLLYSWGSQPLIDMHKAIVKHFHFWRSFRSLKVVKGQTLDLLLVLYSLGSQLSLICIKPLLKHFQFWRSFRSLEVVGVHQKVKHWIYCCYCIPWVPSFRLKCIKPQLKHFYFGDHFRPLEVVRGHQKVKHLILSP